MDYIMKVKDAIQYGKISTGNSKMPGTTFAIDAFACITGSSWHRSKARRVIRATLGSFNACALVSIKVGRQTLPSGKQVTP